MYCLSLFDATGRMVHGQDLREPDQALYVVTRLARQHLPEHRLQMASDQTADGMRMQIRGQGAHLIALVQARGADVELECRFSQVMAGIEL